MKRYKSILIFAALLFAGFAPHAYAEEITPQFSITVDPDKSEVHYFDVYHGETVLFEVTFKRPSNETMTFFWQEQGMGDSYWSESCTTVGDGVYRAVFTPQMDTGAKVFNCFIGRPGMIYRAVFQLRIQNYPNQSLTGHVSAVGVGIVAGVQRNQRPDGSVDSLPYHAVKIGKLFHHVIACNVRRVKAQSGVCHDDSGIFGVLAVMKLSGNSAVALPDCLLYTCLIFCDVFIRHGIACLCKTVHYPLAADTTVDRFRYCLIDVLTAFFKGFCYPALGCRRRKARCPECHGQSKGHNQKQ